MQQMSLFPTPADDSDAIPVAVTTRCQVGQLWALGKHRLLVGDCTVAENVARLMDGTKASLFFTDPPYGMHLDVWDNPITNPAAWIIAITPYMAHDGFLVLCQMFPHVMPWLVALEASELRYKDHVVWVKRMATTTALPLNRAHESIFVYGWQISRYHETKGRYTDVKLPGVLVDTVSLGGIDRYIKSLEMKVRNNVKDDRTGGDTNHHSIYRYMRTPSDRSPEIAGFTNVWSFLPTNARKSQGQDTGHATVKPLPLVQRAIELCTPPNAIVADLFCGSGTSILASEISGRECRAMEISPIYADVCLSRWEKMIGQTARLMA